MKEDWPQQEEPDEETLERAEKHKTIILWVMGTFVLLPFFIFFLKSCS